MYYASLICKRLAAMASPVVVAFALSACASSTTPQLDAKFGESVMNVREGQTLNPEGAPAGESDQGIDGRAAVHAQERYLDSFKTPPKTFEILGIGGSLSGQ